MNTYRRACLILPLLVCAAGAFAQQIKEADRPLFYASQSARTNAIVEAIDPETGAVTLKLSDGSTETLTVGDEARNLDQVSPGDLVTAESVESVTIRLVAGDGAEPGTGEMSSTTRAKPGEMPGIAASNTRIVTATVEDIDTAANTFKLRGPDGVVVEYAARNPANLRLAKVGDLVVISVTESVAIAVEKSPTQ